MHTDYTTGVEVAIVLVLLIAIVVTIDIARSLEPRQLPPPDASITTTQKIIVDLDRRS